MFYYPLIAPQVGEQPFNTWAFGAHSKSKLSHLVLGEERNNNKEKWAKFKGPIGHGKRVPKTYFRSPVENQDRETEH